MRAAPERTLVLRYLVAELRASIRNARPGDLAWVFIGGGALIAYAIGIVIVRVDGRSEQLLATDWLWWTALPLAMALAGAAAGWSLATLAQSRAHAPFLKALPLSERDRRRMALVATLALGLPVAIVDGALVAAISAAAKQTAPLAWGFGATVVAICSLGAMAVLRLRQSPHTHGGSAIETGAAGWSIRLVDARTPRWLGSWAAGHVGGRIRPTLSRVFAVLFLGGAAMLLATASIVHGSATPAVAGGVIGGLAIFMATLSCRPLLSPVLRASALTFGRAVRGLARLPLLLSLVFFSALAAPAYAADPSMATVPLTGGAGLLVLNGIYTAFAAFFAHSRRLAALAFFAALGLTAYETLEYGRTVLFALAALVVFLWFRARKAYRHG